MTRRRGFTLSELLVYAALLGLLLSGVSMVVLMGHRSMVAGHASVEAQQEAMKAAAAIEREAPDAWRESVETSGSPPGIVFLSPRDDTGRFQHDASGDLLWQKWVCFYLESESGRLLRKERKLASPTPEPPADGPSVADMASDTTLVERVVAHRLVQLQFPQVPGGYELRLEAETESTAGEPTRILLQSGLGLRMKG